MFTKEHNMYNYPCLMGKGWYHVTGSHKAVVLPVTRDVCDVKEAVPMLQPLRLRHCLQ